MKNILINSVIGFVAILVGAALMAAVSAFFAEGINEVVVNFIVAVVVLSVLVEVTILIALIIKGIKGLIALIPSRKPTSVKRTYSFDVWMKYWSRRKEKFLTTVSVEAYSRKEAEAMMEEAYPSIMFKCEYK